MARRVVSLDMARSCRELRHGSLSLVSSDLSLSRVVSLDMALSRVVNLDMARSCR